VDWNSAWYKPEIFGETLLYSNAKAFGDVSYNYIYAAKLGADNAALKALNEKYEEVQDYMSEYSENADLQTAMKYYYGTNERAEFDELKDTQYDKYQREEFDKFVELFADGGKFAASKTTDFTKLVGKMTSEDAEEIQESWKKTLRQPTAASESDKEWPVWATVLIIVGSVLIVAAAVLIPVLVVSAKKKAAKAEADATVNAYKRKIDTTDDKTIDVYADEEKAEETTESVVEETVETVEEPQETVEEVQAEEVVSEEETKEE
jgi:major membrane immunogen (membrane-anchored lipoprotein)